MGPQKRFSIFGSDWEVRFASRRAAEYEVAAVNRVEEGSRNNPYQ